MSVGGVALSDYQSRPSVAAASTDRCASLPGAWGSAFNKIIGVALLVCASVPVFAADPGDGLFEGRMCVRAMAVDAKAGDCGPVEIAMLSGNRAVVRISDIVYRLQLQTNEVEIVLMQGTVQIDGFSATYEWQGKTLLFSDPEKGVRYEIDFEPKVGQALR
ncbi:MAG: hypothetical protein ABI564_00265 [Ideonella sp.]